MAAKQAKRIRLFKTQRKAVAAVELSKDAAVADDVVTFDDGWSMGLPADAPLRPRVGCDIDLVMDGGMRVGYSLDGVVCQEADPISTHLEWERGSHERALERIREAEADLARRNRRVAALPPALRERILRFRAANLDFVFEHEPYEMACCKEAVRIAAKFRTEAEIQAFAAADWSKQKEMLPGMDDGHSGNTFGFAILLARLLVAGRGGDIIRLPPAITPLTGSDAHGDWLSMTAEEYEAASGPSKAVA